MIQGSACELDGKKIIHDCLGVWICFGVPVILVMGTPRERERLCVCVCVCYPTEAYSHKTVFLWQFISGSVYRKAFPGTIKLWGNRIRKERLKDWNSK